VIGGLLLASIGQAGPQTLQLLERVAERRRLPDSKGDLFASALSLVWKEHRDEKGATPLAAMSEATVLDAAGAAFAALILAGGRTTIQTVDAATTEGPHRAIA
jgi:hypothetical protein